MITNGEKKKLSVDEVQAMIPKWQQRDERQIRGVFKNMEKPGQAHKFYLRTYQNEPIEELTLRDGERKTLSVAWVNHINSCAYTEFLDVKDVVPGIANVKPMINDDGTPSTKMSRKVQRFAFMPMDYSEDLVATGAGLWGVDEETNEKKLIV
jgi:hypothetical protein